MVKLNIEALDYDQRDCKVDFSKCKFGSLMKVVLFKNALTGFPALQSCSDWVECEGPAETTVPPCAYCAQGGSYLAQKASTTRVDDEDVPPRQRGGQF